MFQCELLYIDYRSVWNEHIIGWSCLFNHIFHLQYYWRGVTKNCETDLFLTLKLCHLFMYKDMIAMPCIVKLFCIAYLARIFSALKQDVSVSSYKHTDPSWPHILRPIHLQQSNHRFRYPLCFLMSVPSVQTMALHRSVMKEDDILFVLYADTYSDLHWL